MVRWSPSGELLASGDDESVIFVWTLRSDSEPANILGWHSFLMRLYLFVLSFIQKRIKFIVFR